MTIDNFGDSPDFTSLEDIIVNYIKDNLQIKVEHKEDRYNFSTTHNVSIKIILDDEVIDEDWFSFNEKE